MKNTKLQNPSLRKRKGFTLIELIVVIAILAILAAIAIPTFLGQLDRARKATHNANVMTLRSAAAVYVAEKGDVTVDPWDAAAAAGYIDTWPQNVSGYSDTGYDVSITAGVIEVLPGKVS
ncbi:MAG: prepilin-type N-terminal cleavage/methylation domain-containing protein [Clostridia bacterium]|nr:prepilin-type N-terminal cleavage/methylation domain-containing protein [Clostridia bacterium]